MLVYQRVIDYEEQNMHDTAESCTTFPLGGKWDHTMDKNYVEISSLMFAEVIKILETKFEPQSVGFWR